MSSHAHGCLAVEHDQAIGATRLVVDVH